MIDYKSLPYIAAMEGMLAEGIGGKSTRSQKAESSTGYDSDSCISPNEEDSSTRIASDVSDDEESPVEKWKSRSKGTTTNFLFVFLAFNDKFTVAACLLHSQTKTTYSTFNYYILHT